MATYSVWRTLPRRRISLSGLGGRQLMVGTVPWQWKLLFGNEETYHQTEPRYCAQLPRGEYRCVKWTEDHLSNWFISPKLVIVPH
ncbi:hypothetical protein TYRP_017705 [Tyrophagus putrescentiae]|nr:hypothetical protein TYRP_017705 [Tyrophagus putrescentiae]